jgi:hypothetical protein
MIRFAHQLRLVRVQAVHRAAVPRLQFVVTEAVGQAQQRHAMVDDFEGAGQWFRARLCVGESGVIAGYCASIARGSFMSSSYCRRR